MATLTSRWPALAMWKMFVALGIPLLMSPMLILGDTAVPRAAFVLILMAVFWLTEAVPLPVTALLPIVLYPLLDIQDTGGVTKEYMKDSIMIFFCGLLVAIAFEFCNLHQRIALRVLRITGASTSMLLLGMMFTTMVFSMVMFNTSATAMMIPIIMAVLEQLRSSLVNFLDEDDDTSVPSSPPLVAKPRGSSQLRRLSNLDKFNIEYGGIARRASRMAKSKERVRETITEMKTMCLLAVAYASNIGGTGVITGTGSNLVALEYLADMDAKHHGNYATLTYANWAVFNLAPMLLNVVVAWVYLQLVFLGIPNKLKFWLSAEERLESRSLFTPSVEVKIELMLEEKYVQMGQMSCHETLVLILSSFAIGTWVFHDPKIIPGWATLFGTKISISTSGLLVGVLFFIVPRNLEFYKALRTWDFSGVKMEPLLDYDYVIQRFPWGIILLLGGGFALSGGTNASGLADRIGQSLSALKVLPPNMIQLISMLLIGFCTNVASNTATASIVVPVLLKLSKEMNLHPFYLTLPCTTTCSYAFMLPVGTPPNALVFAASDMTIGTMIKNGFFMNCACVFVLFATTNIVGDFLFHFSEYSYIP